MHADPIHRDRCRQDDPYLRPDKFSNFNPAPARLLIFPLPSAAEHTGYQPQEVGNSPVTELLFPGSGDVLPDADGMTELLQDRCIARTDPAQPQGQLVRAQAMRAKKGAVPGITDTSIGRPRGEGRARSMLAGVRVCATSCRQNRALQIERGLSLFNVYREEVPTSRSGEDRNLYRPFPQGNIVLLDDH